MENPAKVIPVVLGLALVTTGCVPLAVTAIGVGASAGVSHTMGGYTYKTFTAPVGKVRSARDLSGPMNSATSYLPDNPS